MSSHNYICKLCFSNAQDENVQILTQSILEMLMALKLNINVLPSDNPVICKPCHTKLETNYYFKKKCLYTEHNLSPFAVKNVKINLNAILNQIVKSDVQLDKNVCRLCLQYSDDNMMLTSVDREQFLEHFPEIDLNVTNFVLLCLTCYNTLQKYFIFVTSCSCSEKSLRMHGMENYVNESKDCQKYFTNAEEADTGIEIKVEEDSKDLILQSCSTSMDYSIEQMKYVKSEGADSFTMNTEEDDSKKLTLLNEELDIKSDDENSDTEGYLHTKEQLAENQKEKSDSLLKNSNHVSSRSEIFKCDQCDCKYKWKSSLYRHILNKHVDPVKITIHKCDKCNFQTKFYCSLKEHTYRRHADVSKFKIHKCQHCPYEFRMRKHLKRHMFRVHKETLKIPVYKCKSCDYKSKCHTNLSKHILVKHTEFSKMPRRLTKHIITYHADPSKIPTYNCDYKSKFKGKSHALIQHANEKLKVYKCEHCDYESTSEKCLDMHIKLSTPTLKYTNVNCVIMNV